MKFGALLRGAAVEEPELQALFTCYKQLKKHLKLLPEKQALESMNPIPVAEALALAENESAFVRTLNADVQLFNEKYLEREEDSIIRLRSLEDEGDEVQSPTDLKSVYRRFVDFHGEMLLLVHWSILAYTGLVKILKKHHKRTGLLVRAPHLDNLLSQPFCSVEMMSELIHKAEADIEGLRQRLAYSGAGSACSAINVSRSAKLLHAARSLDTDNADTDAAAAAATAAYSFGLEAKDSAGDSLDAAAGGRAGPCLSTQSPETAAGAEHASSTPAAHAGSKRSQPDAGAVAGGGGTLTDGSHRRPPPPGSAPPPTPQGVVDPSSRATAYSATFQAAAAQQRVSQAAAAFADDRISNGAETYPASVSSGCGPGATPEGGSPTSGACAPSMAHFWAAPLAGQQENGGSGVDAMEAPSPPAREPAAESVSAAAQGSHEDTQQARIVRQTQAALGLWKELTETASTPSTVLRSFPGRPLPHLATNGRQTSSVNTNQSRA